MDVGQRIEVKEHMKSFSGIIALAMYNEIEVITEQTNATLS